MTDRVLLSGFSNMKLVDFRYHIDDDSFINSFIEIIMSRAGYTRHLKFSQPSNIKIDLGFDGNLSGMEILDISERQWCDITIEVKNFEQDAGITFFAKGMEILSDLNNT